MADQKLPFERYCRRTDLSALIETASASSYRPAADGLDDSDGDGRRPDIEI